jgi:hypothetical protein
MIPCICIDDKARPADFPLSKWVEEGNKYNIVAAAVILPQGILGFQVNEIQMDANCYPYKYFSSHRFIFEDKYKKAIFEMVMGERDYSEVDPAIMNDASIVSFVS